MFKVKDKKCISKCSKVICTEIFFRFFKVKIKYFLCLWYRRHKIHILIICVLLLYEENSWHESMNHKFAVSIKNSGDAHSAEIYWHSRINKREIYGCQHLTYRELSKNLFLIVLWDFSSNYRVLINSFKWKNEINVWMHNSQNDNVFMYYCTTKICLFWELTIYARLW